MRTPDWHATQKGAEYSRQKRHSGTPYQHPAPQPDDSRILLPDTVIYDFGDQQRLRQLHGQLNQHHDQRGNGGDPVFLRKVNISFIEDTPFAYS